MNHRQTKLLARTDYAAAITTIIDIDVADPISALLIKFEAVLPDAVPIEHILACITKIELVDGSEVVTSLCGKEAAAVDWYHNGGQFRGNFNYYNGGGTPQYYLGLNFGRYLWDKELALNPNQFRNLQLKVTLNPVLCHAACVHNYMTIWAAMFDEQKINPIGYLMTKNIKTFGVAADSHEYTDLPTDHPYKALYVRSQTLGTEPSNILANIKLSEEVDKRIIMDDQPSLAMKLLNPYVPEVREEIWFPTALARRYEFITPTERVKAVGAPWQDAGLAENTSFYDGDGGRLITWGVTATSNMQALVTGLLPHATWCFPFGDPMDIAEYYDVSRVGNLKLDILGTGGADAAKKTNIFIQQLRRY